jgi:endonuclease G
LPGSSGSPVFNNDWFVVALHHSGVPEKKDGRIQTVDGTDYDSRSMDELKIKWIANEGIRASRIVHTLKGALPTHGLLQPLYSATPANARIHGRNHDLADPPAAATPIPITQDAIPMNSQLRRVTVPLTIQLSIDLGALVEATATAVSPFSEAAKKKKKPKIDAPFDSDYSTRKGFQKNFLGGAGLLVHMPKLTPGLLVDAVRLNGQPNDYHLHYHNYSVVMHKQRRFAIFSAANVSFADRFEISRPSDVWRVDPRIEVGAQVQNSYYESNNFDRGHLTRNEDLEFGSKPVVALQSAADTCHWTNCTPQHSQFNQNKEIWQGIERHILETSIFNGHFNAMVFTGPVFEEVDPIYRKLQYPVKYWKVVAALDDNGKLFATAYIASQARVIAQNGIEATVPFGPYKTFQTRVTEIERLTQLEFWSGDGNKKRLSEFDPLRIDAPGRRRRGPRVHEAALAETFGADGPYLELNDLEEIEV